MASYILLLTITPEGRDNMLADPDNLMSAMQDIDIADTSVLGSYAVLGAYDFVTILRAPDNDAAARFSMELGVRAGVLVNTLPAIPIGRFEETLSQHDPAEDIAGIGPPSAVSDD